MFSKETWKKFTKTNYIILNMKEDYRFAKIIFIHISYFTFHIHISTNRRWASNIHCTINTQIRISAF